MVEIVHDYTALLWDRSWNDRADGTPRIVTYSYSVEAPAYQYDQSYTHQFLQSLQAFSQSDRAQMENAIAQVEANAGVVFVEVDPGEGDINIANYNFNFDPPHATNAGFAYHPSLEIGETWSWYSEVGGDVFINTNRSHSVHLMLHELGHALGLKHPFDDDPILPANLDNKTKTVMSYTGHSTGNIGPFDIDALQFLYGDTSPAAGTLEAWSYDAGSSVLIQAWGDAASEIHGVFGDDEISAGAGDDVVGGHLGDDILNGEEGNDKLLGGDGDDVLSGGPDDDELSAEEGDDLLFGGPGDDVLFGYYGANILVGGPGADELYSWNELSVASYRDAAAGVTADLNWNGVGAGDAGGDVYHGIEKLEGSEHADTLIGVWYQSNDLSGIGGDDLFFGGEEADAFDGGNGLDTVTYETMYGGAVADLAYTGANTGDAAGDTYVSIEGLAGTDYGDDLRGDAADNTLSGSGGNDRLHGRAGDDALSGGDGDDLLLGYQGADLLDGGAGTDRAAYWTAAGGLIADLQYSGANTGDAAGDAYAAIENLQGSSHKDSLRGDGGANVIWAGNGNDTIHARGGDDTLLGQGGDDVLLGYQGADLLNGGSGIDRAAYWSAANSLTADLQYAGANTGDAAGDVYISIENLQGSNQKDNLRGDGGANVIWGGNGNDTIHARGGDDTLLGQGGDDVLLGYQGADLLDGGAGMDRAAYWTAQGGVIADLLYEAANAGDAAGDSYVSIENLQGSSHNDSLRGDSDANIIWGGGGNDTIHARGGDDTLFGQDGNDILVGYQGADQLDGGPGGDRAAYWTAPSSVTADLLHAGQNTGEAAGDVYVSIEHLQGSNHADDLRGTNGGNTIWGGNGDDVILGRAGNDVLIGQGGNDRFVFADGHGQDIVIGFEALNDLERLDLSAVSAIADFADLAAHHLSQQGGDAVVDDLAGNTVRLVQVNAADLHAADFLF